LDHVGQMDAKGNEQYIIDVPFILIRALNAHAHFVPPVVEQLFDPLVFNDQTFEDQMIAMRILRGNLIASVQKRCKIAELYPGAIGHDEDLNRVISIQSTNFCRVAGRTSGSNRDQIVTYDPKKIPVQGSSNALVDITLGRELLVNVARASSGDAVNYHPADGEVKPLYEILQPKSSDLIRDNQAIDPTSKAVLFTRTIREEREKISDTQHKKFFLGTDALLVVISNKPLASISGNKGVPNFDKVVKYLETGKSKSEANTIPKGVILVTHETFKQFIPPILCHSRLWKELAPEVNVVTEVEKGNQSRPLKRSRISSQKVITGADAVLEENAIAEVEKVHNQSRPLKRSRVSSQKATIAKVEKVHNQSRPLKRSHVSNQKATTAEDAVPGKDAKDSPRRKQKPDAAALEEK